MNNEYTINYVVGIESAKKLVDWNNPPSVRDLKQDLAEAKSNHDLHVNKVNESLTALRGELKIKIKEGRSKVQPKLVRKQNECRYN